MTIPATLAKLSKDVAELRRDASAESEAIGDILAKLDESQRCAQLSVSYLRHIHGLLQELLDLLKRPRRRAR